MNEAGSDAAGQPPPYEFLKDGSITWVGDSAHRGTDIYWSNRLQMWVFVDLENKRVETARRFLVARSTPGRAATAFNQVCLASDRDGECRTWVISIDDEAARQSEETIEFVFDSRTLD